MSKRLASAVLGAALAAFLMTGCSDDEDTACSDETETPAAMGPIAMMDGGPKPRPRTGSGSKKQPPVGKTKKPKVKVKIDDDWFEKCD